MSIEWASSMGLTDCRSVKRKRFFGACRKYHFDAILEIRKKLVRKLRTHATNYRSRCMSGLHSRLRPHPKNDLQWPTRGLGELP